MILESNITNNERQYRNFVEMIKSYKKDATIDNVCVHKTSKGNWCVYDENHKKICLISKYLLTDELIESFKIKRCE